jgi:phosphoglycerate dehydrogenase-like enzyme
MPSDGKVRVHIKNNHAAPDTFPNTPEGEEVFTITRERFEAVAARHPETAARLEVFIDWDLDTFADSMRSAEVLIAWNLPTEGLAEAAPNLKWIHCIGAGVEHLCPLDWLPPGVTLVNNKGVHAAKAGEYGLMAILMLHNSLPRFCSNQREARYESIYSSPIAGKTVAVVGVGSLGGAVAGHAKRLGLRVLGVSRHGRPSPDLDESHTTEALDEVLPRADFVFLATPLTPETRNLMDRRRLGLMKPGAGLANIGRAAVVDYDALAERLADGHLSGAILDVFDPEPLPADSPYWHVPNLIVTPHVSADDGNAYVPLTLDLFFENMSRYLAGQPLLNPVDPALGY